jgi:hypothetical protein
LLALLSPWLPCPKEYLSLALLSPWLPCPDVVVKRVFEIAKASSADSHNDLSCRDDSLNFAAAKLLMLMWC